MTAATTALLIDVTLVGIVVFSAWRGYRNGLIRGVFGVVALVVSLFLGSIAATAYSDEFKGMLSPFVGGFVDTTLTDMAAEGIEYEFVDHDNQTDDFRRAYTALRQIGLPVSAAARLAENAVEGDPDTPLSDRIADQLSSALAFIAVFAIAFTLIAIVFAVIGNLVGFVFSLPGLKLVDIIAGVAFGIVKGLLIIYVVSAVSRYFGLLALDILEGTVLLNYLVGNNLIADILGI